MKLFKRLGFYLGGFSIGLVLLAFFLNGKKVSCDYGPEARVKKNLLSKAVVFQLGDTLLLNTVPLDSTAVRVFIKSGEINFSKSDTRKAPCGIYEIENAIADKKVSLTLENCQDTISILKITMRN